jgi:hypothetical protein
MVTTDSRSSEQDASSWWFRALDQRVIQVGLQEWRLHVTGIYVHADEIWIQLAADGRYGGSVLLRVSLDTPVEQAVRLLARSCSGEMSMYPAVVTATSSALRHEQTNTAQSIDDVQHPATGVI